MFAANKKKSKNAEQIQGKMRLKALNSANFIQFTYSYCVIGKGINPRLAIQHAIKQAPPGLYTLYIYTYICIFPYLHYRITSTTHIPFFFELPHMHTNTHIHIKIHASIKKNNCKKKLDTHTHTHTHKYKIQNTKHTKKRGFKRKFT